MPECVYAFKSAFPVLRALTRGDTRENVRTNSAFSETRSTKAFTPFLAIWTPSELTEFVHRFVFDYSSELCSFVKKEIIKILNKRIDGETGSNAPAKEENEQQRVNKNKKWRNESKQKRERERKAEGESLSERSKRNVGKMISSDLGIVRKVKKNSGEMNLITHDELLSLSRIIRR